MTSALPQLFTVAETAAALRLHRKSVGRLIKRGEIDSVRIGAKRLIPLASIEKIATPVSKRAPSAGL